MEQVVRRVLRVMPEARTVLLFGSRARGDARPDSDVDLVVVTPTVPASGPRSVALQLALRGLGVGFDVIVLTPDEWRQASHQPGTVSAEAAREGRILHAA
jgi:predicted nucleotidyltransferase